jgi:broad specificity phosphatase PhoE
MKLFLIRHGQTTGDLEDRYGGTYDDHLTELGQKQLQETANKLTDSEIQTIFHSSLIRARESAEIIKNTINCQLVEVTGFKERDYGILGGLTKVEALAKYPDAVEAHKDYMNTDPEGESYEDFNKRVVETFEATKGNMPAVCAILAHGGSIKRILDYLGEPLPDSIDDGGVIELTIS